MSTQPIARVGTIFACWRGATGSGTPLFTGHPLTSCLSALQRSGAQRLRPTPYPGPIFVGTQTDLWFMVDSLADVTLPLASWGQGPLTYTLAPKYSPVPGPFLPRFGLKFDSVSRSITGNPTSYLGRTAFIYSVRDQIGRTASLPFDILIFDVSLNVEDKDFRKIHWGVLAKNEAKFREPISRLPEAFEYKIGLPPGAGFMFRNNECVWPKEKSTSPDGLWWSPALQQNKPFAIARCGLGTGAPMAVGFTVKLGIRKESFTRGLTVPRAWHRHDNEVTYYVQGTVNNNNRVSITPVTSGETEGMFPEGRTVFVRDYTPNILLLTINSYKDAAGEWNRLFSKPIFRRLDSSTGADVIISGYWDRGSSDPDDRTCGESIACTFPAGTYPHIGSSQSLKLEDPPRWPSSKAIKWVDSLELAVRHPKDYVHLPSVLVHEFGHTFGLGHGGSIMNGQERDLIPCTPFAEDRKLCGLSSIDRAAAKEVINNHTKHAGKSSEYHDEQHD